MEIPEDWSRERLGDTLLNVEYGISDALSDRGSIPVLRMMNLNEGKIDLSELKYSDSSKAKQLTLNVGDVLFNRTNSMEHVGKTAMWRAELPRATFASYCVRLICNRQKLLPEFLTLVMNLPETQLAIKCLATPAVQQVNVNPTQLRERLVISYPKDTEEQRCIAEVLDTADEAIRQTEAVIAKLRLMKAGLLHDLLTRGLDEQGRLRDPHRHPEQFKDSPLGRIPKDWEVDPLSQLLEGRPKNGYSPQEVNESTGTMMLGLSCLTPDGFSPIQLKNAPLGDPKLRSALLNDGDLLLSRSNTRDRVGLAGCYSDIGLPCIYPDLMMRLTPRQHVSKAYLELVLRSPAVRRQLMNAAVGTSGSMLKINAGNVMETIVASPSPEEQDRILHALEFQTAGLRAEEGLVAKLKLQKQGLMHDLLTGRVRV